MALYFLSDLHLWEEDGILEKQFLQFLKTVPKKNDVLILGGDIFDLFIGNKEIFKEKFKDSIAAIENIAKKGCKTYFFEGNHDFHLKNIFKETEVIVCSDASSIHWEGENIWVSHGDRINPKDYSYHIFRSFSRSLWGKLIIKFLAGFLLLHLGSWLSKKSRVYGENKKAKLEKIRTSFRNYAREKIESGYDYVFLSHSHIKDRLELNIGSRKGIYINLGFSPSELRYVALREKKLDTHIWKPF